jgi:predicted  nucleic acid-binding Zn-ribbon protein
MPHQCIECGRTFPDGSKEMLSGCPDCGGNKFQFKPGGATDSPEPASSTDSEPTAGSESTPGFDPSSEADAERPSSDPADPAGAAASSGSTASSDRTDAPDPADGRPERAGSSETAGSDTTDPVEGDAERIDGEEAEARDSAEADAESMEPPASQPGVDELRDELNEQFESIKIVSPGQYELNLMELYDRQEYIISLQEDGRYVIEMPDAWGVTDE